MADDDQRPIAIAVPAALWPIVETTLDVSSAAVDPGRSDKGGGSDTDELPADTVAEVSRDPRGRAQVTITRLPAQVNPNGYLERIADLVRDGGLVGIGELSDDGEIGQTRLVIKIHPEAVPTEMLHDLLVALARFQHDIWTQASRIVKAVSRQRLAGDEIALSNSDWWYLFAEIERQHPQDGQSGVDRRRTATAGELLNLIAVKLDE